ncbi:hypothetical protein Pla175_13770 [Pirellulimonas nuda]|uniref:UPF0056 membrane protein n=1 Tax=Pirellulimonas nuda TaxID=2528009 RepID=A0A518D954_9BACT|nr:MarC family protein [Pirellulimonas nuda]QDU88008.1 hypothetical protein Pla175_13770 [Pirellulimonas nuda]
MAEATVFLKIFIAIYVLVNPLEGVPVFLARTQSVSQAQRKKMASTAAIGVTVILLVALFIGRGLLALLGIGIGAFTVAGGIIIFLFALQMITGKIAQPDPGAGASPDSDSHFALVPLAIPLLAGPGPISSVIVYASKGPTDEGCSPVDYAILAGIIVVVGLATWLALRMAEWLRRVMGETGIEVSTRVSGILVAAIAVELIHSGLLKLFPGIAG